MEYGKHSPQLPNVFIFYMTINVMMVVYGIYNTFPTTPKSFIESTYTSIIGIIYEHYLLQNISLFFLWIAFNVVTCALLYNTHLFLFLTLSLLIEKDIIVCFFYLELFLGHCYIINPLIRILTLSLSLSHGVVSCFTS